MLTLDLVRTYQKGNKVFPNYIEISNPKLSSIAATLIEIYENHQGQERGKLDDTLEKVLSQGSEVIVYRGLAKLLEDRCTFEVSYSQDPSQIREKVFEIANNLRKNRKFEHQKAIQEASQVLGISTESLPQMMYADLKEHHILKEFQTISPENLLKRYNTALAQAILYKATSLHIKINETNPLRYRQLFRSIKFCRLLYQIHRIGNSGFDIFLDGPISLFQASQKYGIQMALFLPTLLHCENWELRADLCWKNKKNAIFELSSQNQLWSHYSEPGVYQPPELQQFKERFKEIQDQWDIHDECYLLEIGGQICIPDYTLVNFKKNCAVYLEIFGFWHKNILAKRLQELDNCPYHLLLAISKKLNVGEEFSSSNDPRLYFYQNVLHPKEIWERLESYCK